MFARFPTPVVRSWLVACAAVATASLAGCGGNPGQANRTATLAECRLPRVAMAMQCGSIDVPENRARSDSRRIRIAFAVLPANTLNPKADPLFILAGGPGQSASSLGPFAALLTSVRKDRDLVLVDQRGTGRSSPLICAAFKVVDDPEAALELDPVPRAAACAKELAGRGVDPAQYTTAAWIADLDDVREALGYRKINVWGGSYGTRAALEYLRRHGDRVRAVILDGVASPAMRISFDIWPSRDAALSAVIDACRHSPACAEKIPDLEATLGTIRERFGATGREIAIVDPRTGRPESHHLGFDHLLAALQPLTYVPELQALIPVTVERAAGGDFGPVFAAAQLVIGDLAEQMNAALHYSVTCAEDVPRVTAADRAALAGVRTRTLAANVLAVCEVWPRGDAPADAATPVVSDTPVLLLSGGLDPATPPHYAAEVAATLSHSRQVVARGYGHIVSSHECAPRLIAAFIDDPSFATLSASCLEHFEKSVRAPLWPDRLGPQP